jgi:hypothetical protein
LWSGPLESRATLFIEVGFKSVSPRQHASANADASLNTDQKVVPENTVQISERQELPRLQVLYMPHQQHSIAEKRILMSDGK